MCRTDVRLQFDLGSQKAQLTLTGASNDPVAADCSRILGGISDALNFMDLPAFVGTYIRSSEMHEILSFDRRCGDIR